MTLYADFAEDQPEFYEMMFMAKLRSDDPQLEQRSQQQIQMALLFLSERVKKCVNSGLISEVEHKACALRLWSLFHGMVSFQVLGQLHPAKGFREFYLHSIEQFFIERGLA